MRDIKFRVWDEATESFVYSDQIAGGMWRFFKTLEDRGIRHFESEQFTGLKDGSGKDIYEGDLVIFERNNPQINPRVVVPVIFEFGAFYVGNHERLLLSQVAEIVDVFGNIHDSRKEL
jgi:hypothetical protein